jgi:hypothetical protein
MSALVSDPTTAAILATVDEAIKAIETLKAERADLVILVAFMAGDDYSDGSNYSAGDIAYAVEKPWKFAGVLAEAKAELAVTS